MNDQKNPRLALILSGSVAFLNPFVITFVNNALPPIGSDLRGGVGDLAWIASSYLIVVSALLIPASRIADKFGTLRILRLGLATFAVGSLICAGAPNLLWMVGGRIIQATGASLFLTTGLTILLEAYPPSKRGRTLGANIAMVYTGQSLGPWLGGVVTDVWNWRAMFMFISIGALTLAIVAGLLPSRNRRDGTLDAVGSLLHVASLVGIMAGLAMLPSTAGVTLLTFGTITGIVHLRRASHDQTHLFSMGGLANRTFLRGNATQFLQYLATFGVVFLLSIYLQQIRGLTATESGALLLIAPAVQAVLSAPAGYLADRRHPRILIAGGTGLTAIGLLALTAIDSSTTIAAIAGIQVALGVGFALFSSPNTSSIMGSVNADLYNTASAVLATVRTLGQSMSIALVAAIVTMRLGTGVEANEATGEALMAVMRGIFLLFAVCATAALVVSSWRDSANGPQSWRMTD